MTMILLVVTTKKGPPIPQGGILAETDPVETDIGIVKTAALSPQDLSVNNVRGFEIPF